MQRLLRVIVLTSVALMPATVFAQASIVGTVRDASGAVLPGVTVEASSPALIEKTRSVTSNGVGQYSIQDLRPGTYSVTFTATSSSSGSAAVARNSDGRSRSGIAEPVATLNHHLVLCIACTAKTTSGFASSAGGRHASASSDASAIAARIPRIESSNRSIAALIIASDIC